MSDDDGTPHGATAAQAADKGWSEQDRRTLIITIAGTLAANLATVILVGGALAFAHLSRTSGAVESRLLVATLGFMAVSLVLIAVGIFVRRASGRPGIPRLFGRPMLWYGWYLIATGWLGELFGAMILIGLAAGVK